MRCFITGTDTGVGKTFFTTSLLLAWRSQGFWVAGYKPFSTGDREDAQLIATALGPENILTLDQINPVHYPLPLSPWIAARMENPPGPAVDIPALAQSLISSSQGLFRVAVEGAGGWLTPLSDAHSIRDFAVALGYPVVIVSRAGLGTLNHTMLTVESVRATGLPLLGIVVNNHPGSQDLATRTNLAALEERTQLPCYLMESGGCLPFPLPFGL